MNSHTLLLSLAGCLILITCVRTMPLDTTAATPDSPKTTASANTIPPTATHGAIAGGQANQIGESAFGCTIGGGRGNAIGRVSILSYIGGGDSNRISAHSHLASIMGGSGNAVDESSPFSVIGGGFRNRAGASYAMVGGGANNSTDDSAFYATIPGGLRAHASSFGQFAYASGCFSETGDAQASLFVLRRLTYDAEPQEMFLDGMARRIGIPVGATWSFDILFVARSENGKSLGHQIKGMIENAEGTTRFIGKPAISVLGEEADWQVRLEADDAHDALVLRVAGSANKRIRWVASVRTVEVMQ